MRWIIVLATIGLTGAVSAQTPQLDGEACRSLMSRPAEADVEQSARVAVSCIVEACVPSGTRLPREIQVSIRVDARRVRARIVEGSLGSVAANRCAETVLRDTPFPRDESRRARVSLTIRRSPRISTPATGGIPARDPNAVPNTPSRNDVVSAMRAAMPGVTTCAEGQTGVVVARFSFHSNGKVDTVRVTGSSAGTPLARCIERSLRSVRIPPFGRATFSVTFPFRY